MTVPISTDVTIAAEVKLGATSMDHSSLPHELAEPTTHISITEYGVCRIKEDLNVGN